MQRATTTESGMGQTKLGKLRLWIAAQQVEVRQKLREAKMRYVRSQDDAVEKEIEAANATGKLAILGQIDAMLAGAVDIPEPEAGVDADA
jgi:hypothetical protein